MKEYDGNMRKYEGNMREYEEICLEPFSLNQSGVSIFRTIQPELIRSQHLYMCCEFRTLLFFPLWEYIDIEPSSMSGESPATLDP